VTADEVVVWLRAEGEGTVSVRYGREPGLEDFSSTSPVKVARETDFTVKIVINGLEPGATYYYRGVVEGRRPGPICRLVTAPGADDPIDVRFAFSGDTKESYQPFSIMDSIVAMRPDFFIYLGDTIYADRRGVASRLPDFWAKYRANRNDLPTQRLFSETSLYVIWDDHEVSGDYDPGDPLAAIGQRAFFDYWPIRQDPKDPGRLYRSFRWGKAAEFFILDTRQYRDLSEGTILGREQMRWFLKALSSSSALFKFVATSVPISSRGVDKWGGYPADREEVLSTIAREKIRGVIFLTADVHYAAVSKVPGGLGLKEFIVGPLATQVNPFIRTADRFEFFSNESFSYGLVKVHAGADPPYAEIDILDENNKLLHKTRIDALQ
jgi:alkaline phosphatase D